MPEKSTITAPAQAEVKIRRSLFIGYVERSDSPEQAREIIARRSREHSGATHNCWAYIVGDTLHCSDAGEPSGSAGRPILNTLRSKGLINVTAVVTRYFGGVKLGVRGLIEAYAGVSAAAIDKAVLETFSLMLRLRVELPYNLLDQFIHRLSELDGRKDSVEYAETVSLRISVSERSKARLEDYLDELGKNVVFEYLDD